MTWTDLISNSNVAGSVCLASPTAPKKKKKTPKRPGAHGKSLGRFEIFGTPVLQAVLLQGFVALTWPLVMNSGSQKTTIGGLVNLQV